MWPRCDLHACARAFAVQPAFLFQQRCKQPTHHHHPCTRTPARSLRPRTEPQQHGIAERPRAAAEQRNEHDAHAAGHEQRQCTVVAQQRHGRSVRAAPAAAAVCNTGGGEGGCWGKGTEGGDACSRCCPAALPSPPPPWVFLAQPLAALVISPAPCLTALPPAPTLPCPAPRSWRATRSVRCSREPPSSWT